MNDTTRGVLLMAYGGASAPNELLEYYTHIRNGRAPSEEELADLRRRYQTIGGTSPIRAITESLRRQLEDVLNRSENAPYQVFLGMKHVAPFIGDVVQEMEGHGISEAIALVLTPHYSKMSVESYFDFVRQSSRGINWSWVTSWYDTPSFLSLIEERITQAWHEQYHLSNPTILFTAHSLPEKILSWDDPYPRQIRESGALVAQALAISHYQFAWQSRGRTGERWLGPDILEVLPELAANGTKEVLVCPIGFVSDHLEILYDLDIQAQALARDLHIRLERIAMPNADPQFVGVLADVVRNHARRMP